MTTGRAVSAGGWDCPLCGESARLFEMDGTTHVAPHRRPAGRPGSEWCPASTHDPREVPDRGEAGELLADHRLARQAGHGSGHGAWWLLGENGGGAVLPVAVGHLYADRMDWDDAREVTLPGGMRGVAPGLLAGEGEV